tara:strand:- start:28 stop:306 length:279 start_codon:yes stop_codon:yes gene_type:complete
MIEIMHVDQVRDWFGSRGYPFDDDSQLKYKIVNISGSRWIFIHDSHEWNEEVEIYYMNGIFCEPLDGWPLKGFSWAKKNLTKLAKNAIKRYQ